MKPKFEIGQKVYYLGGGDQREIISIRRAERDKDVFLYEVEHLLGYVAESSISTDNKKYYILYRSADGLERREDRRVYDTSNPKFRSLKCPEPTCTLGKGEREYRYRETIERDNTVTYIYDEVI